MLPLFPFQRQIIDNLLDEDALCIVARGLGLNRILAELARICATPKALVLLLRAKDEDEYDLQHYFMQMRSGEKANEATKMQIIKNETNSGVRAQLYRQGGLISVTSRILIVDLLSNIVPIELITGIIVHNAQEVNAESIEAFILRVIRQQNGQAFVKALSDSPESFTVGFAPVEKTLKVLGLRHVQLWPRFHVSVQTDLSKKETPVVEMRQPQTRSMVELQQAVLDCLSQTISELSTSTKLLDPETINVESSLFRYFDKMVQRQLDPYWHRLSFRVRGMVNDLKSLRQVAEYITTYDAVSLLGYLDALLLSAKPTPGGLPGPAASWMATDSANILYSVARSRTFKRAQEPLPEQTREKLRQLGLPDTIVPVLEVPPKLEALTKILDEIGVLNQTEGGGPVLVMAGSTHEYRMIQEYLKLLHNKVEIDMPDQPHAQHPQMMVDLLRKFFRRKAQATGIRPATSRSAASAPQGQQQHYQQRRAPAAKRRRVRGGSATATRGPRAPADELEQESSELANTASEYIDTESEAEEDFDESYGLVSNHEAVVVQSYEHERGILESLQPTHVVMYNPNAAFIRQVEMYGTYGRLKQVYFVVYDNSLEEQRYLSAIRREREAFEKLIGAKATLVVTLDDASLSTSPAGRLLQTVVKRSQRSARDNTEEQPAVVVVDVREFRAPLPSQLHAAGIRVVPRTLEVGDYVLHDGLVVERKSLSDLIGSLRSGRLFNQAAAMTRFYACAALLIEFEVNSSFSLQAIGSLTDSISPSALSSQLTLLALAFPRLRILWSSSPYETVAIFAELKRGMPEPDAERAAAVGSTDDSITPGESLYAQTPISLLQSLPGVTQRNYQKLAAHFKCMRELCTASLDELKPLLGAEAASQLHEFLNHE
ncbi:DNA repair protein RAD16 [Coemansia sp. RSA 1250]|nr:DNA repair protein RAD16 [Coemansia sp. RSA 1250]